MDDLDATIPVSKPTPPAAGVTPSQAGQLFALGAGVFDTRPSTTGRAWEPPSVEVLQRLLPQYEITEFVARGGMGAVYKGLQRTLKRAVAIKVLPPGIEDDDELQFATRFKHEAQAMAALSHPNIVAVHDAGEVSLRETRRLGDKETGRRGEEETESGGTLLYFVMDFIEGADVAQLIASEGRLSPARAAPIITAVCEALAFAHEEGIIHRDIKPSNIMIDRKGRVKVADFGLAKTVNLESTLITRSDVTMGTPDYVAPEALVPGTKVDGRADLYAVGVMLYQMLTGTIPRGRFDPPSGVVREVDARFDAIVDKAMQTNREKRYSTAIEMKTDVERISRFVPPSSTLDMRAQRTNHEIRSTKRRAPLLIGTAATVLIGIAAWLLLDEPTEAEGTADSRSSSPGLPVSSSPNPAFPPGQWRDAIKEGLLKEMMNQPSPTDQGYLLPAGHHWRFPAEPVKAGAIRIRTTAGTPPWPELCLHLGNEHSVHYRARIAKDLKTCSLRYSSMPGEDRALATTPIALKLGQAHDLMLVSTGNQLWVTLDGAVILNAAKTEAAPGRLALVIPKDVGDSRLLKAEYVSLDGLSEAEALKVAGIEGKAVAPQANALPTAPPGHTWQRLFREHEDADGSVTLTRGDLRSDAVLADAALRFELAGPCAGLRAEIRRDREKGVYSMELLPPKNPGEAGQGQVVLDWRSMTSSDVNGAGMRKLPAGDLLDAPAGQKVEFWAVGNQLSVIINGRLIGGMEVNTIKSGGLLLYADQAKLRHVEVLMPGKATE